MKRLKLLLLGLAIITGGTVLAQEKNITRELQLNGEQIEAVYYYENGEIAQKGFYRDGKLHGEWIAYDRNGNKMALGEYYEGMKVGKWFFWNGEEISEVDYEENRITSVNVRKNDELAGK